MSDISHAISPIDDRVSAPAALAAFAGPLPLAAVAEEPGAAGAVGDVLDVLRRWGWYCLFASLVLSAVAVTVVLRLFEPKYTATALLEIRSRPYYVAFAPTAEASAAQSFAETQLQVIRSPVVLSRVSDNPEINGLPEVKEADSTMAWLKKNLEVEYAGTSELCQISFTSRDKKTAAAVANAIMLAYIERQEEDRAKRTNNIIEKLKTERAKREEEVERAQHRLRMAATEATGHDPGVVNSSMVVVQPSAMLSLQQTLARAEVDLEVLETELAALEKTTDENGVSEAEVESALAQTPDLQQLDQDIADAQNVLRETRSVDRGAAGSVLTKAAERLAELEAARDELLSDLRPAMTRALQISAVSRFTEPREKLKTEILRQRKLKELWQKRVDEEIGRAEKIGDESLNLEIARSELRRSDEVLQRIADRIVVLRTEQDAPAQAAEMYQAQPPAAANELFPLRNMSMAIFGSFCSPFGLAFLWERLQRRVSEARHVTSSGKLMVLGEVAMLPARGLAEGSAGNDRERWERFAFVESINSLRVSLTLTPAFREVRALAVTSAISGEGKTTLATSLAASLARNSGQPTLLIDTDLRSPDVHDVFEVELELGLVDVLEKRCSLADAVVTDRATGLAILPAGRLSLSPHLVFGNDRLAGLLRELRADYRHIIVDTAPSLVASETMVVASACDGTIVCAMHDRSRQSQISLACERLSLAGARLLGAVISSVPTRRWSRRYGGSAYGGEEYALASAKADVSEVDLLQWAQTEAAPGPLSP